jgi:uncharacterized repeat protein (TIGR03803 family)/VCBS repeat-containing protein
MSFGHGCCGAAVDPAFNKETTMTSPSFTIAPQFNLGLRAVQRTCLLLLLMWPSLSDAQVVEALYSFSGCPMSGCGVGLPYDGAHPRSTLVFGGDGQLYGTTYGGGSGTGVGSVFRMTTSGSITHLRTFGYDDPPGFFGVGGYFPVAPLAHSTDGNLYGVTPSGGQGDGIFFRISSVGSFTKLHDFDVDGISTNNSGPWGGVVQGLDGRFYGTSQYSGEMPFVYPGFVYRLESDWSMTILHHFTGPNGQWPKGNLMRASDGRMYGTTWAGGGNTTCIGYNGCGTVFRINLDGTVVVVHAFSGADGGQPEEASLIEAPDGSLYGVTSGGGVTANGAANLGTIFRIASDGTFTSLYAFDGIVGCQPHGALVLASDGNFYGTTAGCPGLDGANQTGTIYRMTPQGSVTLVHTFQGADGARPFGGLVEDGDGALYGTAYDGGDHNLGVVFKLSLPRAHDATLSVTEDIAASGTLSATDPANGSMTFSIVSNGTRGSATIINAATGAFSYTPQANVTGTDTFTFRANNGSVDTNVATITVTIEPVNDAPVAEDGTASTAPGVAVNGQLAAADVDGPALTFAIVAGGSKGTAQVINPATGAYTYTPQATASGTDTFTFKANDGSLDSNTATVTVTFSGNGAPVAADSTMSTNEDKSTSGRLVATDTERQALTFAIVANGAKGVATITNDSTGRVTYAPNANANGSDTFTFKVNDGTSDSNVAVVTVTITSVPDSPVAENASYTVTAGTTLLGQLIATDGDGDAVTYAITGQPKTGSVSLLDAATGSFSYSAPSGARGNASFGFTATDPSGRVDGGTVMIKIVR